MILYESSYWDFWIQAIFRHQLPPEPLAKAGVGKGYIASDIDFLLIYRDLLIIIVSLN